MKIKGKNGTDSAQVLFGTVTRTQLLGGDSSNEQKEARQLPEQRERALKQAPVCTRVPQTKGKVTGSEAGALVGGGSHEALQAMKGVCFYSKCNERVFKQMNDIC